jgi:hypothetical protein
LSSRQLDDGRLQPDPASIGGKPVLEAADHLVKRLPLRLLLNLQ